MDRPVVSGKECFYIQTRYYKTDKLVFVYLRKLSSKARKEVREENQAGLYCRVSLLLVYYIYVLLNRGLLI